MHIPNRLPLSRQREKGLLLTEKHLKSTDVVKVLLKLFFFRRSLGLSVDQDLNVSSSELPGEYLDHRRNTGEGFAVAACPVIRDNKQPPYDIF